MSTEEAIFRSAPMSFVDIYMSLEVGRELVLRFGELGIIQFVDRNTEVSTFQRTFVKEIRKLDNVERQLRYLRSVIEREHGLTVVHNPLLHLESQSVSSIEQLIADVDTLEERVSQLATSHDEMKERQAKALEKRAVLLSSRVFFEQDVQQEARRISIDTVDNAPLLLEQESLEAGIQLSNLNELALNFIVGSIPRSKVQILNRILFRTLRGNLFFKHEELDTEIVKLLTGEDVEKDVFIVYTHGQFLIQKVRRIIDSLDGTVFDIQPNPDVYDQELEAANFQVSDLDEVVKSTHRQLQTELFVIADQIETWQAVVRREKLVLATLNLFSYTDRGYVASGWAPSSETDMITTVLRDIQGSETSIMHVVKTNRIPPTYHKTNKFTQAFQAIVDAYGIASYQEVNPGLATVVTFPFMFAIMFGDLGHGFILTLIAVVLVLNEKKLALKKKDEIFDMAFSGRYILLLMGIFSMYTGLLYNDVFSKSMTLFKSGWKWPTEFQIGETIVATKTGVYPFGLDWAWHGTENNLIFTNSYKMKLSILMGYAHMSYSFFFSLVNYIHRKSGVDIKGNFLPGFFFMQSIFGYLSLMIIYKWCVDWIAIEAPAPGLLNMLINMFLAPGKIDDQLYKGQTWVQVILVLIAACCVPLLLLYKPMTLRRQNRNAMGLGYQDLHDQIHSGTVAEEEENSGENLVISDQHHGHEEFNFGDIMIHQVIHTIEFCLNCVSHTASYLRLWALSLAHAQLSSVLWSMTIANAFSDANAGSPASVAKVVILFGMWFVLTVCILVLMEGTSAMLHSLRLHWVEAMSKFFEGEGHAFEPFNFHILHDESAN